MMYECKPVPFFPFVCQMAIEKEGRGGLPHPSHFALSLHIPPYANGLTPSGGV